MDELVAHTKGLLKVSSFFLASCLIAWIILPDYRYVINGIILGSSVSILNAIHLSVKVKRLSQMALSGVKKRVSMGFINRLGLSVLAVLIAYKFEQINVISTAASLVFAQFVIFGVGVVRTLKNK
jgi:ATP synthase protein I